MPFVMVQMRDVLQRFPDAGDGFRRDIEAIEANVEAHPHLGLGLARELLQSCCNTIERERGETIDYDASLPQRAKKLIDHIVIGFSGHPDQKAIEEHLRALVGSLNGAVRALSQLSNIPGLRHGGDANWAGPSRRHAMLLAGAVDALSAFLFDSHGQKFWASISQSQPTRLRRNSTPNSTMHGPSNLATIASMPVRCCSRSTERPIVQKSPAGRATVPREAKKPMRHEL